MSTFGGKIQEIPDISVDRFDEDNLNSEVYFLSHCHSDHMRGLENVYFWEQLVKYHKFLYASQISCVILSKMYPFTSVNVKELSLYTPNTIYFNNKTLTVTIISAGHCPGSVMFLFETELNRILYTGDYRINKSDIKKCNQFYNSYKELQVIDKIYLDTTFFSKTYRKFPKRQESLTEICIIIKDHIEKGEHYWINLSTGANYGYEYLFKEIYKQLKMPVHVNRDAYNFYSLLPELDLSVTMDSLKTQIHYNCNGYRKFCNFSLHRIILELRVTAWRWDSNSLKEGIVSHDKGTTNVCYSTHASLEEGMELIRFLKPKSIEMCVESKDAERNEEMNEIIEEVLRELHAPQKCALTPKLFKTEFKSKRKKYGNVDKSQSEILQSPPRERKFVSSSSEEFESPSKKVLTKEIYKNNRKIELDVKRDFSALQMDQNVSKSAQLMDEGIAHSSLMPFDDLQISSEKNSENVLLDISNDDFCKTEDLKAFQEPNLLKEPAKVLNCEEIDQSKPRTTNTNIHSQNVLLDIIDFQPI